MEGVTGSRLVGDDAEATDGVQAGGAVLGELLGDTGVGRLLAGLVDGEVVVEQVTDDPKRFFFAAAEFLEFESEGLAFLVLIPLQGFGERLPFSGELLDEGGRCLVGSLESLLTGLQVRRAGGDAGGGPLQLLDLLEGVGEVVLLAQAEFRFLIPEEGRHQNPGARTDGRGRDGGDGKAPRNPAGMGQPGHTPGGCQQAEVSQNEWPFGRTRHCLLGHGWDLNRRLLRARGRDGGRGVPGLKGARRGAEHRKKVAHGISRGTTWKSAGRGRFPAGAQRRREEGTWFPSLPLL